MKLQLSNQRTMNILAIKNFIDIKNGCRTLTECLSTSHRWINKRSMRNYIISCSMEVLSMTILYQECLDMLS